MISKEFFDRDFSDSEVRIKILFIKFIKEYYYDIINKHCR